MPLLSGYAYAAVTFVNVDIAAMTNPCRQIPDAIIVLSFNLCVAQDLARC